MKNDKVSVLLPIRNGEKYISNLRNSIEINIEANDEVVIINDGSTDGTLHLLKDWASQNSQVNLIDTNGIGLVAALNLGLKQSSNEWIARFDVDDVYKNNRIQEQKKLISDKNVAIFCDYSLTTENLRKIGTLPTAIFKEAVSLSLISSQRTPHPGVLFNRSAVIDVGGYREQDFPAEDLSLWLRLSRIGNLVSVPKVLLEYRVSRNSISGSRRSSALEKKNQLLEKFSINLSDYEYCRDNWQYLFRSYDNAELSAERKYLLIFDLFKASKHLGLRLDCKFEMLEKGILDIDAFKGVFNLSKIKALKTLNRLNLFP